MKTAFLLTTLLVPITLASAADHALHLKNNICRDDSSKHTFSIIDYSVVAVMLLISCAIGTFYGFFGKKQKTSTDFLLGGSNMGTFPMSLSLAAR